MGGEGTSSELRGERATHSGRRQPAGKNALIKKAAMPPEDFDVCYAVDRWLETGGPVALTLRAG